MELTHVDSSWINGSSKGRGAGKLKATRSCLFKVCSAFTVSTEYLICSYIRKLTIYSNTRSRTSVELQVQGQHGTADIHSGLPAPTTAVSPIQTWNKPRVNVWKISATFIDFIVMGLNDAAYGVSVLIACLLKSLLNNRPGVDPLCMSLTLRQRPPKLKKNGTA